MTPLDSERFSRVEERIRKRSRSPHQRREKLHRVKGTGSRSISKSLTKETNSFLVGRSITKSDFKNAAGKTESPTRASRHLTYSMNDNLKSSLGFPSSKLTKTIDLEDAIKKLRALEEKVSSFLCPTPLIFESLLLRSRSSSERNLKQANHQIQSLTKTSKSI